MFISEGKKEDNILKFNAHFLLFHVCTPFYKSDTHSATSNDPQVDQTACVLQHHTRILCLLISSLFLFSSFHFPLIVFSLFFFMFSILPPFSRPPIYLSFNDIKLYVVIKSRLVFQCFPQLRLLCGSML